MLECFEIVVVNLHLKIGDFFFTVTPILLKNEDRTSVNVSLNWRTSVTPILLKSEDRTSVNVSLNWRTSVTPLLLKNEGRTSVTPIVKK